ARSAGVPLNIAEAARVVIEGEPRPVDVLLDEVGGVVVDHVQLGAGARAGKQAEAWTRRLGRLNLGGLDLGRWGGAMGVVHTTLRPTALRLRVEIDGDLINDWDQPLAGIALGNGTRAGSAHQLDAGPDSGLIDVTVSRATGLLTRADHLARAALGRRSHGEDVLHLRGKQVTVTGEPFYCCADGEVYGPERRRCWHVESAAYSLLLP
ncbi:MAG: diacylglycerol/lipid kinase family protein, partial [Dermatophilaceae bacterium]